MREQRAKLSRNNDTTKAINYCLSRWDAFSRFLDDGRLCMSNNAAERELRAVAVGRKNWTFAGADEGGRRAAAIYSLIATAKLNDIDPQAWLTDVLARLPDHLPSALTNCCLGIGSPREPFTPLKRDRPSTKNGLARGRHRMRTNWPESHVYGSLAPRTLAYGAAKSIDATAPPDRTADIRRATSWRCSSLAARLGTVPENSSGPFYADVEHGQLDQDRLAP